MIAETAPHAILPAITAGRCQKNVRDWYMPTRRQFLSATLVSTVSAPAAPTSRDSLLSFGLMADCQYADVPTAGARHYREGPRKLQEAVTELNKHDLAFHFHLGDFIDRDFKSFDDLLPITNKLKGSLYHALGNHDFDVTETEKAKVPAKLNLKLGYYRVLKPGVRLLVVDTTEVSTYRYPANHEIVAKANAEIKTLKSKQAPNAHSWNSRVSDQQLIWLEAELKEAVKSKEVVLVLGHHPVRPVEAHATWNHDDLHTLLLKYPCVKAYLNGHNHAGGHATVKGLHYLTLDGMLNTKSNAFAYANLFNDRLELTGFGRQESHLLRFR